MENKISKQYDTGMIGLGVMGRNLLLNMSDHGFSVAGYDTDPVKVEALRHDAGNRDIYCTGDLHEFIRSIRKPRSIILLVPAGGPVDSVLDELLPFVEKDDLIIDSGNSYFKDTNVRTIRLEKTGIQFMGMGISGGEEGARLGASIMPGGSKESYERIKPVLEAVAARVNGEPCVAWLGKTSSGHFVKMVHNGIEYGIMQLISETYAILRQGLGLSDKELHEVYTSWNGTEVAGFLLEITGDIFGRLDESTGKSLIDEILDVARQKGTGMWTSQSAMELQVPIPTIDMAVIMRDLSAFQEQRDMAASIFQPEIHHIGGNRLERLLQVRKAFYVSMLLTYAQGFAVLKAASDNYEYQLDLATIARIWRGGCIIRATVLEDIMRALQINKDLSNLMFDENLSHLILENRQYLRQTVSVACEAGIPVSGLMASLSYLDGFSSPWLPANLIQAQRDYFGAHTYERIDAKGTFHTDWQKKTNGM